MDLPFIPCCLMELYWLRHDWFVGNTVQRVVNCNGGGKIKILCIRGGRGAFRGSFPSNPFSVRLALYDVVLVHSRAH